MSKTVQDRAIVTFEHK